MDSCIQDHFDNENWAALIVEQTMHSAHEITLQDIFYWEDSIDGDDQ